MKKNIIKIILLILPVVIVFAKEPNVERIRKDLYVLSDDNMEGREAGTKFEKKAIEFIEKRFRDIGLEPKGTKGYIQEFKAQEKGVHGENSGREMMVSNVIGFIDNKSKNTIVIGAHFDHLGWGSRSSLSTIKGIHRGADDNASGVSMMIELAEILKKHESINNNNFLIIAFTGEEKGLWGSNYFVKNSTIEMSSINFMINLDMVGRLKDKKISISGTGTSSVWDEILDKEKDNFEIIKNESGMGPSDYSSFYMKDIPVLHFFTGQHSDYHKITDTPDKINYEGMGDLTNFIIRIIKNVDNNFAKIDFKKTKDVSENKTKFNVTLGVMPDYLYNKEGLRVDGVKEDRPGKRAGINSGDIIIKMGEYDIKDMKDYMKCLSIFNIGDKVEILIRRDQQIIKKEVQF